GVVRGPDDTLRYDGSTDVPEIARRDHSLASALHWSIVWYYQRVATKLGMQRERLYLRRFDYGNEEPSSGLTTFWNGGSLEISPREQLHFLMRLYDDKLPVSRETSHAVQKMLIEPPGTITNVSGEHPFGRPWASDATLSAKSGAT